MSLDTERLDALAQAIVDGASIDWDALQASGPAVDGARLSDLRALLAAVSRDGDLRPGDTWGGLVLQEEVGRGTYGVVYRAWDPSLEREVALKLFRPAQAANGGAERAVREGRLLAKIRHPNVVTVYGADEHDGRIGLWTEFVKGKTLRDVVTEQGPMSAEEAARIGADLCRALAAVHAAGIVHGDIKAQNVMREVGGRIVLMDFGAGEFVNADSRGPAVIGTPAYLAPEVLAGGAPTVASDIYALGVLLFFLSSGTLPYDASTLTGLRGKHALGERRLLRDIRPDVPAWFAQVVGRLLAEVVQDRPRTMAECEGLLGLPTQVSGRGAPHLSFWAGVAVVLVVSTLLLWQARPRPSASPGANGEEPTLGIDVTTEPNSDPDLQAASMEISSKIGSTVDALDGFRRLSVTSAEAPQTTLTVKLSGDTKSVRAAIVIRDQTGQEIMRHTVEGRREALATLKADVMRGSFVVIREVMVPKRRQRIVASSHNDQSAIAQYLRGAFHLSLRREDEVQRALTLFRQAVAAEAGMCVAHEGVAEALALNAIRRQSSNGPALEAARTEALTATACDPSLAEAVAILGYIQKLQFDYRSAEQNLQRAIALDPGLVDAHVRLSTVYLQQGNSALALSEMNTARSLDPTSVQVKTQSAATLLFSRRYPSAIKEAQALLIDYPSITMGFEVIGLANLFQKNYTEAETWLRRAIESEGPGSVDTTLLAAVGAARVGRGERDSAHEILRTLEREYEKGTGSAAEVAALLLAMGNSDEALTWLERAAASREAELGYLKISPRWDALRGNLRFDRLQEVPGSSK